MPDEKAKDLTNLLRANGFIVIVRSKNTNFLSSMIFGSLLLCVIGSGSMIAISFFIVGMMSLNFIKDEITRARSSDNLDCTNPSGISDGTKHKHTQRD
jgi:hypothetical protein